MGQHAIDLTPQYLYLYMKSEIPVVTLQIKL